MLKTILAEVKQYKKAAFLTPTFMLLEVAMEMIIPLMMASIIDDGVMAGNMGHIIKIGIFMVLSAVIGLFAGFMGGKYGALASTGFARNLRSAMFKRIQTFSFSNIDKFSSASLITRLTTDVMNIQNAFQMVLRIGMRAPASLIVALIMSIYISPELAKTYVYAVIFLSAVILILLPLTKRVFEQVFKRYDELNESVQENVTAIRVVKAYVREAYEKEKFTNAANNIYKMFVKAELMVSIAMPLMMATIYTCILVISWKGAHLIVGNNLTTGELMSMLTYCMNIMISLMMLAMIFIMLTMSLASGQRITEVLTEEPSIKNPENPVMEVKDGSIDFNHVNFAYHEGAKEYVLSDIDLHIKAGETIGIIGGTGSAKTSLVNLISRLYDVSNNKGEGGVLVGGVDVRDYDIKTLRDEVSVVLQKNVLFSGTISENLRWGDANASDEEVRHAAALACADEFIEKMPDKYETKIEQGGTNVSGGQRQRLCIARALLKKPKVLILDDSISAVDTATDAKIRKAFREEIPGTTKLIIAQRISSVKDSDRIVVMDDGKIVAVGTHEELLNTSEIYKDVFESQTGGVGDFDEPGKEEN